MEAFTIEAWTYLAIDLVVVGARFIARWRTMGFRGLAVDDFLMVAAVLLYTAETATAHFVGAYWHGLANSGEPREPRADPAFPFKSMTDQARKALEPGSHEYHLRVKGSQTQLFGWLVYTVLLWTLKTCWLFFYRRLGDGVDTMSIRINIGFGLIFATFFGTFFTILCGCWPIEKHWQIYPDPGNFCYPAVSRLQAWTLIVTNLSTDFYIMSIPLPMVWSAKISAPKKIGLLVMFCGGIITAIFGGLRCGYILQNSPNGPQLAGEWSCRESFVAVFISNFPVVFPLIHRSWSRVKVSSTSQSSSGQHGSGGPFKLTTISGKNKRKQFKHPLSLPGETFYERYGSEEDMVVTANRETKTGEATSDAKSGAS